MSLKRPHLISQLGHVELLTPKLEETLKFFVDSVGLEVSDRKGQSVYLRAWGEFHHHSLKITEAKTDGLGHIGWRAESNEDLMDAAQFIEALGCGEGWIEGDIGHGKAYQFRSPGGHLQEIYWDVEKAQIPEEKKSRWKSRPQQKVERGMSARRLDHVTLWSNDVKADREFYQKLGFKHNEAIYLPEPLNKELGAVLAVSSLSHEVAVFLDAEKRFSNLNHVCYALEDRSQIFDAADLMKENGYKLDYQPAKHAAGEGYFFYAIEPGGNRLEIYAGSPLYFAPDYGPVRWEVTENPNDVYTEENIFARDKVANKN